MSWTAGAEGATDRPPPVGSFPADTIDARRTTLAVGVAERQVWRDRSLARQRVGQ
jgi:hypothetical protein